MENSNSENINSKNFRLKNKKNLLKKLFVSGLILILASVLMFIFGVGMFVSRGNYSQIAIKLSEVCFAFWIPVLILGVLITFSSLIIRLIMSPKSK